jgi:hypothetical protein
MTQYENVSVHEYTSGPKEGERFLKFGKGEASGSDIQLATPNNDVDAMAKMERERLLVWSLPEPMTKQETKKFLEEEKPDAVWAELKVEEGAEA